MIHSSTPRDAQTLLRDGWCDEDVEHATGISLDDIVALRAEAASAPVTARAGRVFKATIQAKIPGKAEERPRSPPVSGTLDNPHIDSRSPA